jgi:phosphoglycolate phosphatase
VGDSEVDAETARNAGVDFLAVGWGFRREEQLLAAGAQRVWMDAAEVEKHLLG